MHWLLHRHVPTISTYYSPSAAAPAPPSPSPHAPSTVTTGPPTPATAPSSRRRRRQEVSPTNEPTLPPRKRPPRGRYAEDHDIPDPTPPSVTIQPAIIDPHLHKLYVGKSEDPPDAGWGLYALVPIADDSVICEYHGRRDAPIIDPPSPYVFTFKHTDGSIHTIDAFDPILNRVISLGGYANDPLNESRENARWHSDGNRLYLRATRDIKAHEQIFVHYGVNYWANDTFNLPLMIQAVERYINKVDLAHPAWYHLRLTPLLWHYLYGPAVLFPSHPSPVGTPEDPFPLVPPLPRLLKHRSLQNLLTAMRNEGSLPPGEDPPTAASITNYCRRRGIDNCRPIPCFEDEEHSTPTTSPTIGTSRRAVLHATDIAGVPSFPDMEDELPASSNRYSPPSPVIDMSAYDLPLHVLPAPETYSENSLPLSPLVAMPKDHPDSAALVNQPALNRSDCILFPIFDKRVNNS